jgi:hypothetical protein
MDDHLGSVAVVCIMNMPLKNDVQSSWYLFLQIILILIYFVIYIYSVLPICIAIDVKHCSVMYINWKMCQVGFGKPL